MTTVDHNQQKERWESEHSHPHALPQMDKTTPSSGVEMFWNWFKEGRGNITKGLEMGCGKGRNVIWLAKQGVFMKGFDFSSTAIQEANKRAAQERVTEKANFLIHDAGEEWPFSSGTFDFCIDCFASTDIESEEVRKFAYKEFKRVLKNKGYLLVYTLSTDDAFHKEMVKTNPAHEKNSFLHPETQKFEKIFEREEILDLCKGLKLIREQRIEKEAEFYGKKYPCKHFWMIFQKQ